MESAVISLNSGQPQNRDTHNSYPVTGTRNSGRIGSATTHTQPLELESAAWWNQLQLVSNCRNFSQPQDIINCNSYPAARNRISRRRESAATRIHPPEYESPVGKNQPQLVFSSWNSSQLQDRISRNLYPVAEARFSCRIESAAAQFSIKVRGNRSKLFISFETVKVNVHKRTRQVEHIFSCCCCVYLRYHCG